MVFFFLNEGYIYDMTNVGDKITVGKQIHDKKSDWSSSACYLLWIIIYLFYWII